MRTVTATERSADTARRWLEVDPDPDTRAETEALLADAGDAVQQRFGAPRLSLRRVDDGTSEGRAHLPASAVDPQALDLTAKEFCLLELLSLRSGQIVSRADIWEQLYDFADEADSNVIDVFM